MIPLLGRFPGEGKGYPLQYSAVENSMDCIVRGVTESDMTEQLSLHLWSYTSPTAHNRGDCSYLHLSYYMPIPKTVGADNWENQRGSSL